MPRDLNEIETREPKQSFDSTKYEGFRVKIADVREITATNWYTGKTADGKNNAYNPQSTETCQKIEVETEQLPIMDNEGHPTKEKMFLGDKPLTVTARFGLKREGTDWVISKHEKAALWKFMKKMGVTKLGELKGKVVTLTTEPSNDPEDDRMFLRIVA